jgi:hypothetical protein
VAPEVVPSDLFACVPLEFVVLLYVQGEAAVVDEVNPREIALLLELVKWGIVNVYGRGQGCIVRANVESDKSDPRSGRKGDNESEKRAVGTRDECSETKAKGWRSREGESRYINTPPSLFPLLTRRRGRPRQRERTAAAQEDWWTADDLPSFRTIDGGGKKRLAILEAEFIHGIVQEVPMEPTS